MNAKKKMKIIGIIQVRLGSTRLPKKAMLKIFNKPIIWHIHNRLKFCSNLDEIIIATGDFVACHGPHHTYRNIRHAVQRQQFRQPLSGHGQYGYCSTAIQR